MPVSHGFMRKRDRAKTQFKWGLRQRGILCLWVLPAALVGALVGRFLGSMTAGLWVGGVIGFIALAINGYNFSTWAPEVKEDDQRRRGSASDA